MCRRETSWRAVRDKNGCLLYVHHLHHLARAVVDGKALKRGICKDCSSQKDYGRNRVSSIPRLLVKSMERVSLCFFFGSRLTWPLCRAIQSGIHHSTGLIERFNIHNPGSNCELVRLLISTGISWHEKNCTCRSYRLFMHCSRDTIVNMNYKYLSTISRKFWKPLGPWCPHCNNQRPESSFTNSGPDCSPTNKSCRKPI